MKSLIASALVALMAMSQAHASPKGEKPTIVLVHGAFADGSSWDQVTQNLKQRGYDVVAIANPLRSVKGDAEYLGRVVDAIDRPVVLVGHSYGGLVISEMETRRRDVRGLVFVAAFAAAQGETAVGLSNKDPGSTLGAALGKPVALQSGGNDLYIQQGRFPDQFAADVPREKAILMAASQRPVTDTALNEPAGLASWKQLPSWFIYGDADKNIPSTVLGFMADRANSKRTIVIEGASHVVMVSHPRVVAELIHEAASGK